MKGSSHATCCTKGKKCRFARWHMYIKKKKVNAPDEERIEEADCWSDAIKYLRLYDKKELHVFAVNMKKH